MLQTIITDVCLLLCQWPGSEYHYNTRRALKLGNKTKFSVCSNTNQNVGSMQFFCMILTILLSLYQYTLFFQPNLSEIKSETNPNLADFTERLRGTSLSAFPLYQLIMPWLTNCSAYFVDIRYVLLSLVNAHLTQVNNPWETETVQGQLLTYGSDLQKYIIFL